MSVFPTDCSLNVMILNSFMCAGVTTSLQGFKASPLSFLLHPTQMANVTMYVCAAVEDGKGR